MNITRLQRSQLLIAIFATAAISGCGSSKSNNSSKPSNDNTASVPTCTTEQYLNTDKTACINKTIQTLTDFSLPTDLTIGDTASLSATASSGSEVTYTSGTPDVCTVADSKVTAVNAGECIITATQMGDKKTLAVSETVTVSITVSVASTSKLTKTGVTKCGDYANGNSGNHNNDLDCSLNYDSDSDPIPAGQDGHVQAGQAMSYTLLNRNGEKCVQDNVTGLVWEQKTDDGGVRDKDNTYLWYKIDSYIQVLNTSNYCGHSDWRMPTRSELVSIVDYGRYEPAINPIFTNTQSSWYWSASHYAYANGLSAWNVHFSDGNADTDMKDTALHVRAVRTMSKE